MRNREKNADYTQSLVKDLGSTFNSNLRDNITQGGVSFRCRTTQYPVSKPVCRDTWDIDFGLLQSLSYRYFKEFNTKERQDRK